MSRQLLEALAQVINVKDGITEFHNNETLEVAVPKDLAKQLGISEFTLFSIEAQKKDCCFVSYNSEIFSRCESLLENTGNLVSLAVSYSGYIKQSGFEKLITDTIIPQNSLMQVGETKKIWTPYCLFNMAYTAEADEKRLGKVSFWLNGLTGVADVDIGTALLWESDRCSIPEDVEVDTTSIWEIALTAGQGKIETDIMLWLQSLQRRLNRDEKRITEYYQTIISEIRNKCHKKQLEGEALEKELSRIEATELELKRKLNDLQQRYSLNITAQVHSVLLVWLETMVTECSLKRKKHQRTIQVVYNPYTKVIEPIKCERTYQPIFKFFLDENMQIVKEI